MTQPTPEFLMQLGAALQNGAPLPPQNQPIALGPAPLAVQPVPPPTNGPSLGFIQSMAPAAPTGPLPLPSDPNAIASSSMSAAPPPAPSLPNMSQETTPVDPSLMPPKGINMDALPTPQPMGPPSKPSDVEFHRKSPTGMLPAREMAIRGPQQNAHLMASFEGPAIAADEVRAQRQEQAAREGDVYEEAATRAMHRQAGVERAAVKRQAELEAMQADYEDQVSKLGQMHLDSNRWWANKSTGDKIETVLLAFLGGIGATDPKGNGRNLAFEAIMHDADKDLETQKFDYAVQKDRAQGAQNAFAIAMDRYQNEDAATAAARAGAIDFMQAKLGKVAADWKGTDAANYATDMMGRLASERERTIAAGLKFVPAAAAPGKYKMFIRGQEIPGLVSEADAQKYSIEHGVKPDERMDEKKFDAGVTLGGKQMEIDAKNGEKADEGAKFIASQLQSAGVPQARAAGERALAALNKSPGGKGEAIGRFALEKGVPIGGETVSRAVMPDDANAREQAYSDFMNAAMKATFGNVTASEEVRAARSYGTTGDPAARKRSIEAVLNTLDEMERSAKAGTSPAAQDKFDKQREAASGGKAAAPPSAKKGW